MPKSPIGTIAQALVANINSIAATHTVAMKIGQAVNLPESNELLVSFDDGSRLRFVRGKNLFAFDRVGAEMQDMRGMVIDETSSFTPEMVQQAISRMQPRKLDQALRVIDALRAENTKLLGKMPVTPAVAGDLQSVAWEALAQMSREMWLQRHEALSTGIIQALGLHPNTSDDEVIRLIGVFRDKAGNWAALLDYVVAQSNDPERYTLQWSEMIERIKEAMQGVDFTKDHLGVQS